MSCQRVLNVFSPHFSHNFGCDSSLLRRIESPPRQFPACNMCCTLSLFLALFTDNSYLRSELRSYLPPIARSPNRSAALTRGVSIAPLGSSASALLIPPSPDSFAWNGRGEAIAHSDMPIDRDGRRYSCNGNEDPLGAMLLQE